MKMTIQHIGAAALLAAVGTAQAGSVTAPPYTTYKGTSELSFNQAALGFLDTAKLSMVSYGNATLSTAKDTDGYWLDASASTSLYTASIDEATHDILGTVGFGGLTLYSTYLMRDISRGFGWLTITDLNIDLVNKFVYGTVSGSYLGPKTEALWSIGSITGATSVDGPGTYTTTLSDLKLTDAAFADFSQGLRLLALGSGALPHGSFGSITTTMVVTAVPEPSTYALMGLGLVGMSLVARRRRPVS